MIVVWKRVLHIFSLILMIISTSNIKQYTKDKSSNSSSSSLIEEIPIIPFKKICDVADGAHKEGEPRFPEQDNQRKVIINYTTIKTTDSIEYTDVGLEQLINIKKIPKCNVTKII